MNRKAIAKQTGLVIIFNSTAFDIAILRRELEAPNLFCSLSTDLRNLTLHVADPCN